MRNYFTFGDYDSREFGVFITRDGVYNAPKRVYRQIQVPGRNGDLMLDEGRFENIDVTYPCLIYKCFDANVEGLRNALLSHNGYVRIMDSYHPDEYRLGCFSEELSVVPKVLGDGGTFEVTFNCKPQRFLTGGEVVHKYTEDASINNPTLFASKPLIRATFDTANENYVKMPYSDGSPYESNGITYTTEADGSIRVVGTCGSTRSYFSCRAYNEPTHLPPGNYHFEGCPAGGSSSKYFLSLWFRYNGSQVGTARWDYGTGGVDFTISQAESQYDAMIQIYVQPGVTIDELFTPSLVADTDEVYFYVGSDKVTLQNRFAYIDIDSDIQDCYSDYSNANQYVQFQSNDFPVLEPGVTGITLGAGLESIEITPRWFRL